MKKLIVLLVLLIPLAAFAEETAEPFDKAGFRIEGQLLTMSFRLVSEQIARMNAQMQFLNSELKLAQERKKAILQQVKDYNSLAEQHDMPPIK